MTIEGPPPQVVRAVIAQALAEDIAEGGDVTTAATVAAGVDGQGALVPREAGVVAGIAIAADVFATVGEGRVAVDLAATDGDRVTPGQRLLVVTGPVRDILTAERTALNLLCHLSGIATATRAWVDAVAGTGAVIRDTRKTLPGLRALQKYAVRCGGGRNHRMSLSDAALVKDNHVVAAGGVVAAFDLVRSRAPEVPLEVEVDTLDQAKAVVDAGATLVLLDNMSLPDMATATEYAHLHHSQTEASGGLTLDRARAVAETGVDYLAVGALTHSARALDIGLDLD